MKAETTLAQDEEILRAALIGYEHRKARVDDRIAQIRTLIGTQLPEETARAIEEIRAQAGLAPRRRGRPALHRDLNGQVIPAAPIGAAAAPAPAAESPARRAPLSATARKKIAIAQRKRWKEHRAKQAQMASGAAN